MTLLICLSLCALVPLMSCAREREGVEAQDRQPVPSPAAVPPYKIPDYLPAKVTVMVANSLWGAQWSSTSEARGSKDALLFIVPVTLQPTLLAKDLLHHWVANVDAACSAFEGRDGPFGKRLPVEIPEDDRRFDYRSFQELCRAWKDAGKGKSSQELPDATKQSAPSAWEPWNAVDTMFFSGRKYLGKPLILAYSDPYVAKYTIEYPYKWLAVPTSFTEPPVAERWNIGVIVASVGLSPMDSQDNRWVIIGGDKAGVFYALWPQYAKELRVMTRAH
jgi:hypothetical protein